MNNKVSKKIFLSVTLFSAVILVVAGVYSLSRLFFKAEDTGITILIDKNDPGQIISPFLNGSNMNFPGDGSGTLDYKNLYFDGTTQKWIYEIKRPVTLDAPTVSNTKDAQISPMRFMNGSVYDWRAGIGPIDERPQRVSNIAGFLATDTPSENTAKRLAKMVKSNFGTDEFIWFCQETGAEPLLTASVIYGIDEGVTLPVPANYDELVRQAMQANANWVEYVNGSINETVKSYFSSGVWQPTSWTGVDPDKKEVKVNGRSWFSYEQAPQGYFSGLRWYFAKLRKDQGEINYKQDTIKGVDGNPISNPYTVKYWELGNEVEYNSALNSFTHGWKWVQPTLFRDYIVGFISAMKGVSNASTEILISTGVESAQINKIYPNWRNIWNSGSDKIEISKIERDAFGKVTVTTKNPHKFPISLNSNLQVTMAGIPSPDTEFNGNFWMTNPETCGFWSSCNTFTFQTSTTGQIKSISSLSNSFTFIEGVFGQSAKINSFTKVNDPNIYDIDLTLADGLAKRGNIFIPNDIVGFEDTSGNITAQAKVISRSDYKIQVELNSGTLDTQQIVAIRSEAYKQLDYLSSHDYSSPVAQSTALRQDAQGYHCTDQGGGKYQCEIAEKYNIDGNEFYPKIDGCTKTTNLDGTQKYTCLSGDQTEYDNLFFGDAPTGCVYCWGNDVKTYIADLSTTKILFNKPIFNTEYNIEYGVQGNNDADIDRLDQFKLKSGLAIAYLQNGLIRSGLDGANQFSLSERAPYFGRIWRMIFRQQQVIDGISQPITKYSLTPVYHVLKLYSHYAKGVLKKTSTNASIQDKYIDYIVTQEGDKLRVLALNLNATDNKNITLDLGGLSVSPQMNKYVLNSIDATGMEANNEADGDGSNPMVKVENFENISSVTTLNLSAHSLTVFEYTIVQNPPSIEITYPIDGESVNTTPIIIKYTVDGEQKEESHDLVQGTNEITITATNSAGSSSKTITINYQPDFPPGVLLPKEQFTTGWNMVAFPLIAENNFTNFLDLQKLNLQWFNPTSDSYIKHVENSFNPQLGLGYWLKIDSLDTINASRYTTQDKDSVELPVGKGWNIVGNPFNTAIDPTTFNFKLSDGSTITHAKALELKYIMSYGWSYEASINAYKLISSNPIYKDTMLYQQKLDSWRGMWFYLRSDLITNVVMTKP